MQRSEVITARQDHNKTLWVKSLSFALVAIVFGAHAADTKPLPPVAPGFINPTNSVFIPGGKDPFFPERIVVRQPNPISSSGTTTTQTTAPVVKKNPLDYLNLKITGLIWGRKPMVSVNSLDLFAGSTGTITVPVPDERNVPQNTNFKVTCLEITRKSAKIQVAGETTPRILYYREE